MRISFLAPNLCGGLTIMTWPPELPASPILELLAGRVVTVPFDGSTVVEGTVCPTTASSSDAVVCGTLAAGLEAEKDSNTQIDKSLANYSIATNKLLTYCS